MRTAHWRIGIERTVFGLTRFSRVATSRLGEKRRAAEPAAYMKMAIKLIGLERATGWVYGASMSETPSFHQRCRMSPIHDAIGVA